MTYHHYAKVLDDKRIERGVHCRDCDRDFISITYERDFVVTMVPAAWHVITENAVMMHDRLCPGVPTLSASASANRQRSPGSSRPQ